MSALPQLSEFHIRDWVGEASFERGQRYFRQKAILNPLRQSLTLKSQCTGSRPYPYHVEVTLGPRGIAAAHCSCPAGSEGGHCKHVAALLLTFLNHPDSFLQVQDIDTSLEQRSKTDLIALIRKMVARYPDLQMLLELPSPESSETQPTIDPEVIRRQVSHTLHSYEYEAGSAYDSARGLLEIVEIGMEYGRMGNWRNAATVYRTVAREVLDKYGMVQDDEGDLAQVANQCAVGLSECLVATLEHSDRTAILRALFEIYRWDVDFGGIGVGDEVPDIILRQATPEERREVIRWIREALPAGSTWSDGFHRETLGGFLLDLEGETLDDETFLSICRETGRLHDLADRLLDLNLVDEATTEAKRASDYYLLGLADLFVQHGHGDIAESLIRERANTSQDARLVTWLKKRAVEEGNLTEALTLAETLFWKRPSLEGYEEVRDLAKLLKRWERSKSEFLSRLTAQREHVLLTEIHLMEGDILQAIQTVQHVPIWQYGPRGDPLAVSVAHAAEDSQPHDAIRLYTSVASALINFRGRPNYAQAAMYLTRVRELCRRVGQEREWQTLIDGVKSENRRLRALIEELGRLGI